MQGTILKTLAAVFFTVGILGTGGVLFYTQTTGQASAPGPSHALVMAGEENTPADAPDTEEEQKAVLKTDEQREISSREDKDQAEARRFIYRVWPTLETSHLEENIPKAKQALNKCKDAGDFISLQELRKGTQSHADRLRKELAALRPDLVTDDEREARRLKKIREQIVKLAEDIQNSLRAAVLALPPQPAQKQRILRWRIVFENKDSNEYARQLEALGAKLALPTKERNQYRVICDLSKRPVATTLEDVSTINQVFMMDNNEKSIRSLLKELGLKETPEHLVVFLPRFIEDELVRKELDFAHRAEKDILETTFRFAQTKRGFDIRVASQRAK